MESKKRSKLRRLREEEEEAVCSIPKRRSDRFSKKEKTVDQLCEELGIEDVELTYSTEDFENWTIQKLFDQYVRPLIIQRNPHASKENIQKVLDTKWKEFAIMNPYIPKGEEVLELGDEYDDADTETQDDDLSDIRLGGSISKKRCKALVRKSSVALAASGFETPLSGCAGSEVASASPPPSPGVTTQVPTPIKIKISKKKKKRGRKRE
ncbi:unnamed protein product, partial [Dicrocoelium dendriticum]